MKSVAALLSTLTALLLAAPAADAQQTVYKVRLKDGSVQFTDSVPAGATVLERIEVPAGGSAVSPMPAPTARPGELDERMRFRQQQLEAAHREVIAAEAALEQARRALEAGRAPRADELQGVRGGGTRPSPAYDARIAQLQAGVAAAEERTRRAYDARNALR